MAASARHGRLHHVGRVLAECGEDAAGVQPSHSVDPEQPVPVDILRTHLGRRGVPSVGHADRTPHSEPSLGEVEPVADGAPEAVVRHPTDEAGVDTALADEVLDEPAYLVVG